MLTTDETQNQSTAFYQKTAILLNAKYQSSGFYHCISAQWKWKLNLVLGRPPKKASLTIDHYVQIQPNNFIAGIYDLENMQNNTFCEHL